nr:hypothetical protein [Tanacetum cinerariifolium]
MFLARSLHKLNNRADPWKAHERVNKLRLKLDEVQKSFDTNPADSILCEEEYVYVQAFNEAKLEEERFLKQKAKFDWLEAGDTNLAYFNKTIKCRNQRSRIDSILNTDNIEVSGSLVLDVFVSYYEQFLGLSTDCNILNEEGLLSNKVSVDIASNMMRDVTNDEIKAAMFDIGDDRAPGSDGYTSVFFKKGMEYWIKEFVSDNQSSFILGRRISDNILITEERFKTRYHRYCEEIHLINVCFSDDLFLFARGDVESSRVIMDSLEEFKLTSGLIPSILKSTTYFCNVLNHNKVAILSIIPFFEGELLVKYLEVPLISLGFLNRDCKILVEKSKNRIRDWKNNSLSFAGRLQLCKSVISSMHVSWASVLIILKGIIYDIHQLIRGFLWCNRELKRGKVKIAWDDICLPKSEGGLGMDLIPPVLQDILLYLLPMGDKRTVKSVFGKLIMAASAYFIWMEQNNRTFKNTSRSSEEIHDLIMVTVRLKLISFRFKNTNVVTDIPLISIPDATEALTTCAGLMEYNIKIPLGVTKARPIKFVLYKYKAK